MLRILILYYGSRTDFNKLDRLKNPLYGSSKAYRSAVFRIRIWIHMCLSHPDPLVRGMDPALGSSISKQKCKKNLDSYGFVTSFRLLFLKNDVK